MSRIQSALASLASVMLLATGCTTYKNQSATMTSAWAAGQPAVAAKQFSEKAEKHDKGGDSVVWHLEAGAAYRAAGNFVESNQQLDAAANKMKGYEEKAKVRVGNEAGAIMSNQQNLPYEGKPYDKIMLHTYKALNFLAMGDIEKARPEVIRAYQRQQDAVEENARRIEKAQAEADKAKKTDKEKVDKAKADPKFSKALEGATNNLENFKFYADYVNPFTVYLDGLYFMYAGAGATDLERANKSFQRVIEVAGENKVVQSDAQFAANLINGQNPPPSTYVIFETGQGASLDQIRIDIPIIITSVSYVGAAFPKLAIHGGQATPLTVRAGDVQETTAPLANMDAIIALDFKNEYPSIITKTMIATVAKAAAAYAVNEAVSQSDAVAGLFAKLVTAGAQAAVNIADTRSWTTLPKEFEVARVPTPADRKLTLSVPGSGPAEVTLMDGTVNVVYVKSISTGTPLLVSQFKLK